MILRPLPIYSKKFYYDLTIFLEYYRQIQTNRLAPPKTKPLMLSPGRSDKYHPVTGDNPPGDYTPRLPPRENPQR